MPWGYRPARLEPEGIWLAARVIHPAGPRLTKLAHRLVLPGQQGNARSDYASTKNSPVQCLQLQSGGRGRGRGPGRGPSRMPR